MKKSQAIPRSVWEERVKEYLSSGKTQIDWCKEKNINMHTFNSWFVKLRSESGITKEKVFQKSIRATKWLGVEINNEEEFIANRQICIKVGKVAVEVSNDFDKNLLTDVVKVLVAIC